MRRVITLLAVTATALLLGMGSAQAHSELISSSPAADSVLDFGPPVWSWCSTRTFRTNS